jgi:hypothetical protein
VRCPGRELLTTYEQGNDGFWDAIRMNLAQFCYVQSLAKKSKVGHPDLWAGRVLLAFTTHGTATSNNAVQ